MMRTAAISILIFLGLFTTTAFAATAVPDSGTLADYGKMLLEAIMHGQYWFAGSLGVVMLCAAAKKYLPEKYTTDTLGDVVGTALAFLMAAALSVASAFAVPGAVFSLGVLATAAKVGLGAVGAYNILHKTLGWLSGWSKLPSWMRPLLELAGKLVGSDALAKAKAAGDAAVEAKPATGLAGDTTVKDVE